MPNDASIRTEFWAAKREFARMRREPLPLVRSVAVVPGYRAMRWMGRSLARQLQSVTSEPDRIIDVAHTSCATMEDANATVRNGIADAFGSEEPIDYVGVSMGGLIGRALAMPEQGGLRIERLFTLSTPHRGARIARFVSPDPASSAMISGSAWLDRLDQALPSAAYRMRCYGRTRDWWVGTASCAPVGAQAVEVRSPWHTLGHMLVSRDLRLIVDLARLLRGESAWLSDPEPALERPRHEGASA